MKDYILNFEGYWRDCNKGGLPTYKGVYLVYRCNYNVQNDTVNLIEIIYIVHRIQNEIDLKYIYSVLPYFSADYITKIKQTVPGEALLFGNFVPMPLMVKINKAVPDPDSKNCEVDKEWFNNFVIAD